MKFGEHLEHSGSSPLIPHLYHVNITCVFCKDHTHLTLRDCALIMPHMYLVSISSLINCLLLDTGPMSQHCADAYCVIRWRQQCTHTYTIYIYLHNTHILHRSPKKSRLNLISERSWTPEVKKTHNEK